MHRRLILQQGRADHFGISREARLFDVEEKTLKRRPLPRETEPLGEDIIRFWRALV